MEKIITEFSLWYLPLCVITGVIYGVLLYFRERKYEYSTTLKWILGISRSVVVTLIAVLLLNPLIRAERKSVEKPVILLIHDNSKSIVINSDSSYYKNEHDTRLDNVRDDIQRDYEVIFYPFGKDLENTSELDFTATETDISSSLQSVYDRYSHRNVGAAVLFSDGITNRGLNPLYTDIELDFPLYTVALGDTAVQRDLIISKVNYNRIVYAENEFPLEIDIQARKANNLTSELTVSTNNTIVFRETLDFNSENEFKSVRAVLKSDSPGKKRYRIALSDIDSEISKENNIKDVYIDVLEDKQKILILANAPDPDISAIRQTLTDNINYEVESVMINDFSGDVAFFNLVILHGLPSMEKNIIPLLDKLKEKKIPTLHILSAKTDISRFNLQETGLKIEVKDLLYNEALPELNPEFNLFTISDRTKKLLNEFPPLISPYGNLQKSPLTHTFLFQKIGTVGTSLPLLMFNQSLDRKIGVLVGSGIWKWKLKNYSINESFTAFNEILNKTAQFLAIKTDKSLFRVYSKNQYNENDAIEFEAEVYNDIYELTNSEEVSITITGENDNRYPFVFSKTSDAYRLNAGSLPPGNYSYEARVNINDEIKRKRGEFSVSSLKLEQITTVADHGLLYNLSLKYGGEMLYPDQLEDLPAMIKNRGDVKPVSYMQKRFSELLNIPHLLILILFLLSMEWFIRKRAGGY